MARTKITIKLNPKDIDRAIREVKAFKKEFIRKCEQLVETLTEYGAEVARLQIKQLDAVYTGELMNSIEGYYSPTSQVGIIKADTLYAAYVEFGTGVVGKSSPHPDPQGWVYDVNKHGEKGWVYYDENLGAFVRTKGFKSRPFMHNTARQLEKECARIAEEVFNRGRH